MQFHTRPFKTPPNILKEGEGDGMKDQKGGKREVWWGWEKRGWKLQKNFTISKVRLFARKFRPIYCKYLHVEQKNVERKDTSSLLFVLCQR